MYNECRHILPGGRKCKSPALKGKVFCYYHTASRRSATNKVPETGPVLLSSVEDASGIAIALNQVIREFGKGHIDRFSAGTFLYALQIASSLIRKSAPGQGTADTIRELCEDPIEGIIALEKIACDPEDCQTCEKRRDCKDTQYKEPKVDYRAIIAEFQRDNPDPYD